MIGCVYTHAHGDHMHTHAPAHFGVCMHIGDYIHVVLCVWVCMYVYMCAFIYTYKCYE